MFPTWGTHFTGTMITELHKAFPLLKNYVALNPQYFGKVERTSGILQISKTFRNPLVPRGPYGHKVHSLEDTSVIPIRTDKWKACLFRDLFHF